MDIKQAIDHLSRKWNIVAESDLLGVVAEGDAYMAGMTAQYGCAVLLTALVHLDELHRLRAELQRLQSERWPLR